MKTNSRQPKRLAEAKTSRTAQRKGDSRAAPCSVERAPRSVIEHKLLTALEDDNTVAILASKQDLETFLAALRSYKGLSGPDELRAKCKDLGDGIEQLLREAFPPNAESSDRE